MVHSSSSSPRHHVLWTKLALLFGLLGALTAGCRTQQREDQKSEQRRLTLEMWRELVEKGTLSPVDSMEDPFGKFHPEMGVTPEDYKRLGLDGPIERVDSDPNAVDPPTVVPEKIVTAPVEPELGPILAPVTVKVPPPNYYRKFGNRIVIHDSTGLITKPYPMRSTAATHLLTFMQAYSGFPLWKGEGPQDPDTILVEVLAGMEEEFLSKDMRAQGPAPGAEVPMGDWFVVTAKPSLLEEVETFIDTFAAGPPQIEIEAKIVEWVVRESLDLGVSNALLDFPGHTLVDQIGWGFPNSGSLDAGGEWFAGLSTIHDGVTYAAMFEALASYDNVSIISRPKVAVRDGTKAKIIATEEIPYLKVGGINNSGNATTTIAFQSVGVQLYVTPRLVGTGTIALQIDIEASQQTGNAVTLVIGSGAASAGTVSVPILSTRSAETVVYLKPQQAVILGGLITERIVEEEDGVPILKDLPLIGYLFKSTFEITESATLLFFIRPRLIEGTDLNQPF